MMPSPSGALRSAMQWRGALSRDLMGDGVIDLPRIRSWVRGAGFGGLLEVEIFSAGNWWTRNPDEVLATVTARAAVC